MGDDPAGIGSLHDFPDVKHPGIPQSSDSPHSLMMCHETQFYIHIPQW